MRQPDEPGAKPDTTLIDDWPMEKVLNGRDAIAACADRMATLARFNPSPMRLRMAAGTAEALAGVDEYIASRRAREAAQQEPTREESQP